MFEKVKGFLKEVFVSDVPTLKRGYEWCGDCGGTGQDTPFTTCDSCNGEMMVPKWKST